MKKDNKYLSLCRKTLNLYSESCMGVYAGNATLFIITAMFPLLMLIIAIVNLLPGYDPSDVTAFLFRLLPDLSAFESFLNQVVRNLRVQSSDTLASLSAVTALWSASAGVTAMQKGLMKLGNATGNGMKNKLRSLIFTFLLVLLIPSALILQVFGRSIVELVTTVTEYLHVDGIAAIVHSIISRSGIILVILTFIILLLTYTFLPGYKRKLKDQLPGAAVSTLLCILFTSAFSYFIPRFYHSSALYGSLASLFLVLLWLRMILMIFFAGDALNVAIQQNKNHN